MIEPLMTKYKLASELGKKISMLKRQILSDRPLNTKFLARSLFLRDSILLKLAVYNHNYSFIIARRVFPAATQQPL